ncbi:MAG: transglycosylase [Hydrogenophilales bacterium CG03_land_8_20_14_0_80_62_28]|nr:MAG: transglycosylase [Hydrogenophilales bacterium CG03_land_8_20_14_0_80_62_28]
MTTLRTIIATIAFGLALEGPAVADVYANVDAQGIKHYTNQTDLDGYQLIIAVLKDEGVDNRAHAEPVVASVARYAPQIEAAAEKFSVDKALVHAVITAESGYNPAAVSRAGARGLMQLMPQTAKRYGVGDVFDPEQNIHGGVHYLRDLLDRFNNNLELAVAAYNAGENAVAKHGGHVPPYRETRAYVPKVLALYDRYRQVM